MCALSFTIFQSLNVVTQLKQTVYLLHMTQEGFQSLGKKICQGLWSIFRHLTSTQSSNDLKSYRCNIRRRFKQYLRVNVTCSMRQFGLLVNLTYKNRTMLSLIEINLSGCSQSQLREFSLLVS